MHARRTSSLDAKLGSHCRKTRQLSMCRVAEIEPIFKVGRQHVPSVLIAELHISQVHPVSSSLACTQPPPEVQDVKDWNWATIKVSADLSFNQQPRQSQITSPGGIFPT